MTDSLMSRRSFVAGSLAAGVLATLDGCVAGSDAGTGSAPVEERALTVGLVRPPTINPGWAADPSGLTVTWQLFDALTTYNFEARQLEMLAAERVEASEDARTFTFHLREARFCDEAPVTAACFKRAWERLVAPPPELLDAYGESPFAYLLSLVAGYADLRAGVVDGLAGVACPDDLTLQVTLSTPYADFPYLVAHPALGPVPLAAANDPLGFAARPIGNGPFMVAEAWTADAATLPLVRFDAYEDGEAAVDALQLYFERDSDALFRAFQTDELDVSPCPIDAAGDVASSVGRSDDGRVAREGARLVCVTEMATSMLACNCAAAPLDDAAVRGALSLAIDRSYLTETLYRETRTAADGVLPPAVAGYRSSSWPYAAYDAKRAAELLDETYPIDKETDERGLAVRLAYDEDGGHGEVMKAIAENIEAVGVACELEALDAETLKARLAEGDFDLARVDWTADAPVMDAVLFPLFFSANAGTTNVCRYADEGVDERLAEARAELDEDTRRSLLQDADNTLGAACPVIPLMYHARSYVVSGRVAQLAIDPQGRMELASVEME